MRPLTKKLATIFLTCSSSLVLLPTGGGCDKLETPARQAEKKSEEVIQQAVVQENPQALATFKQALSQATDSPAAKARASALLAQAEYQAGVDLMRKVSEREIVVQTLGFEIAQLAAGINASNSLVKGYKQNDPQPIKQEIAAHIADAQGDANKTVWLKDAGATLPTLSAANQESSRLEGEISKRQDTLRQLTQQRDALRAAADQFLSQSRAARGQQSVDLFKQASEQRKKAADTSIEMDKVNAALMPLQADLAMVQAQRDTVANVIKQLQEQEKLVDQNFAGINQQIDQQNKIAKGLMDTGGSASAAASGSADRRPESIAAKATLLAKLSKDIEGDRDTSAELLRNSVSHFDEAAQAAENLRRDLDARASEITKDIPEKATWEDLKRIYSLTGSQLQKGIAQQTLAMLLMQKSQALSARLQLVQMLKPILQGAGLSMPAGLDDSSLSQELAKARTEANDLFKQASEDLSRVVDAPLANEGQKASARVAGILTNYAWSELDKQSGNQSAAKTHKAAAIADIKTAGDENIALPALPPEIAPAPPPPASMAVVTPVAKAPAAPAVAGTPADAATVAEIKQTAHAVIDAVTKGDVDAIKTFISASPEQQPFIDTAASVFSAHEKLRKAAVAKFGEPAVAAVPELSSTPGGVMPSPAQIDQELAKLQIMSTGPDSVSMYHAGDKQPMVLKKVAGQWKVDLTAMMQDPQVAAMLPMMAGMLKPLGDAMTGLAADVEAGKFNSVDELKAAIQKLNPFGGMAGPPGAGAGPGAAPRRRAPAAPQGGPGGP